jgi:hypothetical protein
MRDAKDINSRLRINHKVNNACFHIYMKLMVLSRIIGIDVVCGRFRTIKKASGGDLLSHIVTDAVPSALEGLTSVFGMGTGVSPPPLPPESLYSLHLENCTV